MRRIILMAGLCLATAAAAADEGIPMGPEVFGALRAREVGPAVMSGRIAAIDAVAGDPRLVWVGTAGGGVWHSRDGGVTFAPKFDEHNQSIGAVCIDQARPDTVWVGTGESWVRNSVSVGDGVYRTVDGGDKWTLMGLAGSERIAEIIIHPADPATVYVAAMGPLWNSGGERGLYRTSDGGATWERILFVDDDTGCVDIALDPDDPSIIYAAMWQFRRSADFFTSGGPGSGLYRSGDGGGTWTELRTGLPEGELGRIAIAVPPTRPETVYAVVESAVTAFYRSDDKGATWRQTSDAEAVKGRPFYFSLLIPDPVDPDRVYKTANGLLVSRDGGTRWEGTGGWVHADRHALWINPRDPNHMIVGTDGGVYITRSRGNAWRHVPNLPVSQFYRVAVDDRRPFWVYGGLQDNGTWRAPSRSVGGIENADWENLGGGDGFAVAVDRRDPDLVYWEWQGGNISRLDLRTGESKDIKPLPTVGGPDLRWHWNTPIATSGTDPKRLYIGSQFLHRSLDQGETWQTISPDLTTDDPAKQRQRESGGLSIDNTTAENHCTIFSIAESPLDKKVIWVGTDDGNLQVSDNDGKSWRNVAADLVGVPAGTWISCVEPSRHDRQTAYVTCDGHRSGDRTPYLLVTRDLGRSWQALVTPEIDGYCHVVRQDPVNPDLLFLGTEAGLFISLDGGRHWGHFAEEFPPVSIRDLVIQPRESSLVMGTHGRGIWIIDDVSPLRAITAEALARPVALLPAQPAVLRTPLWSQHSPGDTHYAAGNPRSSAQLLYYLQKRHMFGDMKIEILDQDGQVLKTLPGGKRKGLNVVTWTPRLKPPKVAPSPVLDPAVSFAGAVGPAAPEGRYTWRLTKGQEVFEGTVDVTYDPEYPHDKAARAAQQQAVQELYDMLARLSYVCDAVAEARDDARARAAALPTDDALATGLKSFAADLDELHGSLIVTERVQGISGRKALREKLVGLYAGVAGYGGRPTGSQVQRMAGFRTEIAGANTAFTALTEAKLGELNTALAAQGLEPVVLLTPEAHAARGD